MTYGVRVLINTKNNSGEKIQEYGYITRRINAHLYEVYGETSNVLFNLSPEEFKEITEGKDLYGIRNKIL